LEQALADAPLGVRLELIRALGDRGDASAAPKILELAHSENEAVSSASLQALASLGGPELVPDLLQMVIQSANDDRRAEAADTLNSICQRIESHGGQWDIQSLALAVKSAPLQARLALLPICSGLTDAPVRDALRAASQDPDPAVREAAIRALCETRDAQLLPDLLKVACASPEKKFRVLAIRGCVRMASGEDVVNLPVASKTDAFKMILDTPLDAGEKRLVLSGLGAIAALQALTLAAPMLDDPDVRAEAAQAVIHIADSISARQPREAGAALKKVLAISTDPAARISAETALKKIQ
jgi:HEAT repeat protein